VGFLAAATINFVNPPAAGVINKWWSSVISHLSHFDAKVANLAIMLIFRSL
jgi:hypothetical protein